MYSMATQQPQEAAYTKDAKSTEILEVPNETGKSQPWRKWLPENPIPCSEKPWIGWKPDKNNESAKPWVDWIKSAGIEGAGGSSGNAGG